VTKLEKIEMGAAERKTTVKGRVIKGRLSVANCCLKFDLNIVYLQ
jgi:hypothetical protein